MLKIKERFALDLKNITRKEEQRFKKNSEVIVKDIINDAVIELIIKGHFQTGKLVDGFYYKKISDSSYIIGNKMPYAGILERGSPKHPIDAVNKPFLVFETKYYHSLNNLITFPVIGRDGGFLQKTKHVDHPGIKAEWFLKNAILSNFKKIKKRFL